MATTQDMLNAIAQIIGGTQPQPVSDPFWYSGYTVGDGSGIPGLEGSVSSPTRSLQVTPVALVEVGEFKAGPETGEQPVIVMGEEFQTDDIKISLFVSNYDPANSWPDLVPYRDTIPAVFRSHMQLLASPDVLEAFVVMGKPGIMAYAGISYIGWDFTLRVRRLLNPVYTA